MRVLVTGAYGLIGSARLARLHRDGHALVGAGRAALPAQYHRLFAIWFALGWPAFIGVIAIFALMIWKPPLW